MSDGKFFEKYEKMKSDLDQTMSDWEKIQEEIDSFQF